MRSEWLSIGNIDRNLQSALAALHAGRVVGDRRENVVRSCLHSTGSILRRRWSSTISPTLSSCSNPSRSRRSWIHRARASRCTSERLLVCWLESEVDRWAKEFYAVRSRIVHGDVIKPADYSMASIGISATTTSDEPCSPTASARGYSSGACMSRALDKLGEGERHPRDAQVESNPPCHD